MKRHLNNNTRKSRSSALKITLTYSFFALLWLLVSDQTFTFLFENTAAFEYYELLKDGILIFFSAVVIFILVKRQLSKESRRQLQILKYNNTLASLMKHSNFISGDINGLINTLTSTLSDVLDVERVSIWKLSNTNKISSIEALDLWESSKKSHSKGTVLNSIDFPKYFEALLNDRTLTFSDVYSDNRIIEFTKEYFPANNIVSMLDAPFHFSGDIAGVVCLEHIGKIRKWTIEEEAFIISAADILSIVYESSQRMELEITLRRSEKMEALGKLTGGIAHDYNNMLGIIYGYTELLEIELQNQPNLLEYTKSIFHASERGSKLTKKLLSFSRNKSTNNEIVDLNVLLNDEKHMLEKTLTPRIDLQLILCDNAWSIWVDSADLEDVIINLSINAMHAITGNGTLTLETNNIRLTTSDAEMLSLTSQEYLQLKIIDNGCGIEPTIINKVFEPFFSTKGDKGTGLGLSQVHGFVERCHGAIKIESELEKGTCITMYFPRYQNDDKNNIHDDSNNKLDISKMRGSETILVVDDEVQLLKLTSNILLQQGYHVLRAENAEQALNVLENNPVDVLMTDVIMSGINGYQLAAIVKKKYPEIKIQLASGFADDISDTDVNLDLKQALLRKPYTSQSLLQTMNCLINSDLL